MTRTAPTTAGRVSATASAETLVHYTDSMELEPWAAKSWENDGDLTWTIVLQDNVTFSNGRAMDAAAVKQCLEHLLENHDRAPGDTKIADMQADGQTLTITTNEPNPALMNYLGDPYGCIIDVDASDFDTGVVIGTGPYVVKEMVTDDHLTLTKNETYWNGTPKLDELTPFGRFPTATRSPLRCRPGTLTPPTVWRMRRTPTLKMTAISSPASRPPAHSLAP